MALRIKFTIPDSNFSRLSAPFGDDKVEELQNILTQAMDNMSYFHMTLVDGETVMYVPRGLIDKGIFELIHEPD